MYYMGGKRLQKVRVVRVCPALEKAGIKKASSKNGIEFCTGVRAGHNSYNKSMQSKCPYDVCILTVTIRRNSK